MRCLACSIDNDAGSKYCTRCGSDLGSPCPRCGAPNKADANFCGQCAAPLAPHGPSSISAPAAERRQITVVFCDLVDSTRMAETLDPEDWREVLRSYQLRCTEVVRGFDGYVAQYLGDGLLVYFGYPLAHEDGPVRAVRAALAMVRAVHELKASVVPGLTLRARLGVHTGPVVVGQMGNPDRSEVLAVGETPNLAARIEAVAEPGSVAISEATYRLVGAHFEVRPLGLHTLKGFSTPIALYEARRDLPQGARRGAAAAAGLAPLVGRADEVQFLVDRWSEALTGKAPVVAVSGEAGIGKSRLVQELGKRVAADGPLVLECRASALHQATVLHPVLEMVADHWELSTEPSAARKVARLREALEGAQVPTHDALPILASLLSLPHDAPAGTTALSPQKQRQAAFEALVAWLFATSTRRPVLLVCEDLHWADPSTLELVRLLIDRAPPGRMLLVITHRPQLALTWSSSRLSCLEVPRLEAKDALVLLKSVLPGKTLPADVEKEIVAKSEGVPLYVEEIGKAVGESPTMSLAEDLSDGVPPSIPPAVPPSVRDSLMARLDRQGQGKTLIQVGSVLGREFRLDVLAAVHGLDETSVRAELDRMLASELLFRGEDRSAETYLFKHALIRDVAYGSLLRSTRQHYHRSIVNVLRERFPEVAEAQPEVLAHHLTGAGLADEAFEQWVLAGHRAIARCAYLEALRSFDHALIHLRSLPPSLERDRRELGLRLVLGLALVSTRGYGAAEVEQNCDRCAALAIQFGDLPLSILWGLWAVHLVRGDLDATARLAVVFERVTETSDDPVNLIMANGALGVRAFYTADYSRARDYFAKVHALCRGRDATREATEALDGQIYAVVYSAWSDAIQGLPERARDGIDRAVQLAEQAGNPYSLALALGCSACVARDCDDVSKVRDVSARALAIATEHGFPMWSGIANICLAWADLRLARSDEEFSGAMARLTLGLEVTRQSGCFITYPYYQSCLAEALLARGRVDEAAAVVADAFAFSQGKLASNYLPMLQKLHGDVLLAKGDGGGAQESYHLAAAAARAQGARLFELEIRLASESARGAVPSADEGRARLATLVASFPEGTRLSALDKARSLPAATSRSLEDPGR